MNTLPNGTIAVGAPGSEARRQAEAEDAVKPEAMRKLAEVRTWFERSGAVHRTWAVTLSAWLGGAIPGLPKLSTLERKVIEDWRKK